MKYVERDFSDLHRPSIRCDLFNGLKPYYASTKSSLTFSQFYICRKSGKDRSYNMISTNLTFIYKTKWEF